MVEAIISEIIEKAQKQAAGLVSDADVERTEMLERVKAEEERKQNEAIKNAEASAEAILARRKTLCGLEARKIELAAKQQAIDAAFEEAVKKILNMTDPVYRELLEDWIVRFADDGDRVIVAERDAKRIHEEWLNGVSKKCGKHLTLSEERHNGKGGVILSGRSCDKNLTLETMLGVLRESALPSVAKRLFR